MAKKAVELAPRKWWSLNTLGVAHYRNGDWKSARDTLGAALSQRRDENAFDGFFMAMSLWRLGETEPALEWLAKAERWRLRHRPDDVELLRFRAEAELLFGPSNRCLAVKPPPMPSSVAEALRDPSFALPPMECPPTTGDEAKRASGKPGDPGSTAGPDRRALDVLDHALYFMDMI